MEYTHVSDEEALEAFRTCARFEGILPALESSHALAYAFRLMKELPPDRIVVVCLSGRGDKDTAEVARLTGMQIPE